MYQNQKYGLLSITHFRKAIQFQSQFYTYQVKVEIWETTDCFYYFFFGMGMDEKNKQIEQETLKNIARSI